MVLSKWLAAVVVFAVALAPTLVFVWMLFAVSDRGPDLGQVWSGYFGLLLQGGAFLAVGVCASAFSRNQLAAALGGFVVCVLLTMVGLLEQINAVRDTEWSARLVEYLSLQAHLDTFFRGLVDLRDVVFLGSLTVFFLFLAVKGVELLKWR
jgi:ABC-2 type transport system permease protein